MPILLPPTNLKRKIQVLNDQLIISGPLSNFFLSLIAWTNSILWKGYVWFQLGSLGYMVGSVEKLWCRLTVIVFSSTSCRKLRLNIVFWSSGGLFLKTEKNRSTHLHSQSPIPDVFQNMNTRLKSHCWLNNYAK